MSDEAQVPPAPPPEAPPPPASPPPPVSTGGGGGASSGDNRKLWLVLDYLWLLALIPLLVEQEDQEVQWHAKHGLVITGAELAIYIVLWALSLAGLACLTCLAYIPLFIGSLVVRVLCIDKAFKGERFLIPGLSDFADKF